MELLAEVRGHTVLRSATSVTVRKDNKDHEGETRGLNSPSKDLCNLCDTQPLPDNEAVVQWLRRRLLVEEEGARWRMSVPLMSRWLRKRELGY